MKEISYILILVGCIIIIWSYFAYTYVLLPFSTDELKLPSNTNRTNYSNNITQDHINKTIKNDEKLYGCKKFCVEEGYLNSTSENCISLTSCTEPNIPYLESDGAPCSSLQACCCISKNNVSENGTANGTSGPGKEVKNCDLYCKEEGYSSSLDLNCISIFSCNDPNEVLFEEGFCGEMEVCCCVP